MITMPMVGLAGFFAGRSMKWGLSDNGDTVSRLCRQGLLAEAVEALGVLVKTDCCMSRDLLYIVLKKCMVTRDLVLGRKIHAFMVRIGYDTDVFLCNHILRMYSSHGRLQDAMNVFIEVGNPDAFMWSSVISAHVNHGQVKQALVLYQQMRRSTVQPDGHVFVAALQACARGSDLETGHQVHADVLAGGVDRDVFVSNALVHMYAKCGSLEDAQNVFDGLDRKDVVTWNAMIAGYSQKGMGHEALGLYSFMLKESLATPDSVTFLLLLQACASMGMPALEKGRQLHIEIRRRGYEADAFVANTLVNMYAKCGSVDAARRVFDALGEKDVVTWNAIIAGYTQQGMWQESLLVYRAMQEQGTSVPNSVTFVCLLQACASGGPPALENGKQLHLKIRERGQGSNAFVASSLVNMYAKCGSLEDAQRVFDGLGQKDVVTWTALILGYCQQGMGQEALAVYSAMQEDGMAVPDCMTFVCLIQACAIVGSSAVEKGKQLHAQIRERGLACDVLLSSSLVNMYVKCGSWEDAQIVFAGLVQKDTVLWNTMIAGYSQQGMSHEAIHLYSAMQEEGTAVPDCVTFVHLLQACASIGAPALEKGKQLHAQISEGGHDADLFVVNSLVNMYSKCGSLEAAQRVFDGLCEKDVATWTALIAGYSQLGMGQEALHLYSAMQGDGMAVPDSVTLVCLLQACASVGTPALARGKELHAQISEQGHEGEGFVISSLVNMYGKCGSLEDAERLFDGLVQKDVVTWNAMLGAYSRQGMGHEALCLYNSMQEEGIVVPNSVTFLCLLQACASVGSSALEMGKKLHAQIRERGLHDDEFVSNSLVNMYAKCGSLEDARLVFEGLVQQDVVTWTALIAGYSQQGMGQEALHLYSAMQLGGIAVPNAVTFACLLQACADLAALQLGKELHAQIEAQGLLSDGFVACSLINMYGKSGSMVDAQQVFDALPKRDVASWSALIAGYASQGDSELVFLLVQRMKKDGIQPSGITLLSVLTVCSHVGLVNKAREYFKGMEEDGIPPTVDHYTCMVDLLGRTGRLDEALSLVRAMPAPANASIWHTLLGACQKWSNVEVGIHAFNEALHLDEMDATAYVIMSNIYTSVQMWKQAEEIQARRVECKAWKQPGQTWWTDLDGLVLSFLVAGKAR